MMAESGDHEAVDMDPGFPSQGENFKCLKDLNNVLRQSGDLKLGEVCELLNRCILWEEWKEGRQDLNMREIRELLNKKIDGKQWNGALQQLLEKDSYFMRDGRFEDKKNQKDLKTFLEYLLFACVEDDLEEHFKAMIDWLKKLQKVSHLSAILKPAHHNNGKKKVEEEDEKEKEEKCFYENNLVMRRACKKRNKATVFVLFKAGFRLKTELEKDMDNLELTIEV